MRTLVVCDNASRDGAETFLQQLTAHVPEAVVVRNRHFLSHARGMRRALRALRDSEEAVPMGDRANVILFCDTDVIFRDSATTCRLADVFTEHDAAFAGELRRHMFPYPEAQASFLAVRRDWLEDPRTTPWVNHGSPAYWLQRSVWRHGGVGVDFPSNRGGFVLHRGRSGVAAASSFLPGHSYSTVSNRDPHYMGVPDGARIWGDAEERYRDLLTPEREEALAVRIGLALSGPG